MTTNRGYVLRILIVWACIVPTAAPANTVRVESLPVMERLDSCNSVIALAAADEITSSPESLREPLGLFRVALEYQRRGKYEKGVFWYYAAMLRTQYQLVFERGDRGQLLQVMHMTVGPAINGYALQDVKRLTRILDQVLTWDKATQNPHRPAVLTAAQRGQVEQVYKRFGELKKKLAAEKSKIEEKAKADAAAMPQYVQPATECEPGEVDPALTNTLVKEEEKLVVNFVRNHPAIAEIGIVKSTSIDSQRYTRGVRFPTRYEVSVGIDMRWYYAIVDVDRNTSPVLFILKCTNPTSSGHREANRDVCSLPESTVIAK